MGFLWWLVEVLLPCALIVAIGVWTVLSLVGKRFVPQHEWTQWKQQFEKQRPKRGISDSIRSSSESSISFSRRASPVLDMAPRTVTTNSISVNRMASMPSTPHSPPPSTRLLDYFVSVRLQVCERILRDHIEQYGHDASYDPEMWIVFHRNWLNTENVVERPSFGSSYDANTYRLTRLSAVSLAQSILVQPFDERTVEHEFACPTFPVHTFVSSEDRDKVRLTVPVWFWPAGGDFSYHHAECIVDTGAPTSTLFCVHSSAFRTSEFEAERGVSLTLPGQHALAVSRFYMWVKIADGDPIYVPVLLPRDAERVSTHSPRSIHYYRNGIGILLTGLTRSRGWNVVPVTLPLCTNGAAASLT